MCVGKLPAERFGNSDRVPLALIESGVARHLHGGEYGLEQHIHSL